MDSPGRVAAGSYGAGAGRRRPIVLAALVVAVLVNYAAQIPYYLHQYYPGAPSWPGLALLALTFVWFLAGYRSYVRSRPYGYALLLTYLAAQVLFYGHSVLLSVMHGGHAGAVAQLSSPSPFLVVIFAIGYLNFVVAVWALVWLIAHPRPLLPSKP
ncbi:hypothetical protein [Pseudonocardia acidicola]|uniref:Uncharacterized protein n=1 Tax=Pseudonocardia acidicola TaxID=2724939 RepID=A0ABX1S614_9PSEU|nr:hypothetical protein [Pseudonocardia acidicola]NMH96540.1 hypothetical protein [Pseudonocardia acidicola]